MKSIILISFSVIFAMHLNAQRSSIGLRGGGLSAFSWKYIDQYGHGVELMIGSQDRGLRLTGLIEKYKPTLTHHLANFYLFTGFGCHSGYTKYKEKKSWQIDDKYYYSERTTTSPIIGGDFIVGAEYRFESVPISLSMDYKPYFEFFGRKVFRVDLWDFGFTFRYVFNNLKS